jgi:hypothetical protein
MSSTTSQVRRRMACRSNDVVVRQTTLATY